MNTNKTALPRFSLILSMCIFGTIGLLRKYIDLPSGMIALARAFIGTLFLVCLLLFKRQKPDISAIGRNLAMLILSGAMLGFNWILLFEAYCYTSVATATLCYYMAPVLIIVTSPLFFRERLTVKKLLCVVSALIGIVLVSGVLQTGITDISELRGVFLGLAAAVLYAAIVMVNKAMKDIPALDRTIVQLAVSCIALLPYTILSGDWQSPSPGTLGILLLIVAGIVHTGIAYALYFGAIHKLPAQASAIYSYIDPVLAIVLSALFLQEPLTLFGILGAVMILGAAWISER